MMLNISDLVWLPVLLPVFWIMGVAVARHLNISNRLASALYVWHTLFSILYYFVSLVKISDARGYYAAGQNPDWVFAAGYKFVTFLSGILVSLLGMGFLTTFIVFGFIGYIGMLLLAHLLLVYLPEEYGVDLDERLLYVVLFLPSLNYWSSALGKDALAFFSCCLALYAVVALARRSLLLFLSILIMYAVRPHAAICMLLAIFVSLLFSSGVDKSFRVFLSVAVCVAVILLWPYVYEYVGFERKGGDVDGYLAWSHGFGYNGEVGDVVLSDMSWPMRLFTYMFRPLFIDAGGVLMLLSSFENVLLLALVFRYYREIFRVVVSVDQLLFRYSVFYSVMMWVLLGNTTPNLGTAYRQKTMFLPALFVLMVFASAKISADDGARTGYLSPYVDGQ